MNDEEYPLVSAIMLAGKVATTDVVAAIDCFRSQTYPYKELIIINNATNQFTATDLNIQAESNVFLIDSPTYLNAGMARNYGIRAANGRILAQFDADYWHAPERLETQIAALAQNEAHICMLSDTLMYSYVSGRAAPHKNHKSAILGTMVFVRPSMIDYPSVSKNEELGILNKMVSAGMKPTILESNAELCCKLLLSADDKIYKPDNNNLTGKQFKLIKKIISDRYIS